MPNFFLKLSSIFLLCLPLLAQATEISPLFGIGNDSFDFSIENLGGNTKQYHYKPNIPGLSRLGVSAYGFGASMSFRSEVKDLDPRMGESTFFDFQIGYNKLEWGVDLFVQDYKGFYTEDPVVGTGESPFYLYPELHFIHYGLSTRKSFLNDGFSVSSLLVQDEQIKKTAGSYFAVGSIRYHALHNDQSFIPTEYQTINLGMDELRELKTYSLNLGLGAGKYWVSSSGFFFGSVFDLLGTLGQYNYQTVTENLSNYYGTTSFNLKFGLGYSGESFRTGVSVSGEITTLQGRNSAYIKPSANQFMLYLRWAFKN